MAVFVNDTFTEPGSSVLLTSHTGETGATWVNHSSYSGDFAVDAGDYLRFSTGKGASALPYASGDPIDVEYKIEWDRIIGGTTPICACGPAARIDTGANTVYNARYEWSVPEWQLYKFISGTPTLLNSNNTDTLSTSTTYAEEFNITDAEKAHYSLSGTKVLTSADNSITAKGKVGIRDGSSSSLERETWDNFVATDIIAGGPAVPIGSLALLGAGI